MPGMKSTHYHGDLVRKLFLAGAIVMLVTLPMLNPILPIPIFKSLLAIIILGIIAGLEPISKVSSAAIRANFG